MLVFNFHFLAQWLSAHNPPIRRVWWLPAVLLENYMLCKECAKPVKPLNPRGSAGRYCNITCRNRHYNRKHDRAKWQREYNYKKYQLNTKEKIQCLVCGKWFRQVGSHIVQVHGITARKYREEFDFDVKRGQLPDDLRELKAGQVFENRTVENLKAGQKFWFKKGQHGLGLYRRSRQTMERLKELHKYNKTRKEGV